MSRLAGVRPTRRGKAVAGVVALALLMAATSGTRTLDIVYAAGAALLGVTAVGVARLDAPTTGRNAFDYGSVGERRDVELRVDAERPIAIDVEDGVSEGLGADARFDATSGDAMSYEVRLETRGRHSLGPLSVTVTDAFGLWRRTFVDESRHELVVYPRIRTLDGTGLRAAYREREETRSRFDAIRPYQRGDPLRDVNWKASAKQPDELVVTEYTGEAVHGSVTVAVTAGSHTGADAAAEAAASVVVDLLDSGLAVGVTTPAERIPAGAGERHRRRVLAALATFGPGGVEEDAIESADVSINAPLGARSARVTVGDETHRFDDIVGGGDGGNADSSARAERPGTNDGARAGAGP
mgnify:CR=1 FL=1